MNISLRFSDAIKMKHLIARAIFCGTLLMLPSCQLPGLIKAQQGPGLPPGYNGAASPDNSAQDGTSRPGNSPLNGVTSPENSAQLGIDDFYNDPMLMCLIQQGIANNRELMILNQDIQIATSEVLQRQGAYLPFVTFGANASVERPSRYTRDGAVETELAYPIPSQILPGKRFPDPLPDYKLGLNLLWDLDIWRELRNARDSAIQRLNAAKERRNYFVTRLIAEIAENYYSLIALDKRLEVLDQTIKLQQQALQIAEARLAVGRSTALPVQRFQADVRRNQSEKLLINQEIVEAENRINSRINRFPGPVARTSPTPADFFDLNIRALQVGVPAQLLLNRPDIRQAERELEAAGLEVKSARARFFPRVSINASTGFEAFDPKYLFRPDAIFANAAGELVAPLVNKTAIRAVYLAANARQLDSVYNYQRVILNAYTEVVNRVSMVEKYRQSIEIKKQQLASLEAAVETANKLFQAARIEYGDVLFSLRDLLEARTVVIETKRQQLSAVVNAYQALGGGDLSRGPVPCNTMNPNPRTLPATLPAPAVVPPLPAPAVVPPVPVPKPAADKDKTVAAPREAQPVLGSLSRSADTGRFLR